MTSKFKTSAFLITVLVFISLYFIFTRKQQVQASPLDDFAKCLAEKQLVMYGAYWCKHCQNQKKLFGNSFKYVSYVECTAEPKRCSEKGVEDYPTWITGDGTHLVGEQSLQKLSEASICPLP